MSGKYLCFNDMAFTQFQSCTQVISCPSAGCRCYPIANCPLQQWTFGTCYSPINKCTGSYSLVKNLATYQVRAQASEGDTTSTLAIYTDLIGVSPTRQPTMFVNSTTTSGGGDFPIPTRNIIYGVIGLVAVIVLLITAYCCCLRKAIKAETAPVGGFELVKGNQEVDL